MEAYNPSLLFIPLNQYTINLPPIELSNNLLDNDKYIEVHRTVEIGSDEIDNNSVLSFENLSISGIIGSLDGTDSKIFPQYTKEKCITNKEIQNNFILEKIYLKYEDDLVNFEYVKIENIKNISIGNKILYINKNTFLKKSGTLYKILSNDIFQICNQNRLKKWFIYTNEYVFFNKIRTNNLLRNKLQNLINNDFNFKKNENIIENSVYIYKK